METQTTTISNPQNAIVSTQNDDEPSKWCDLPKDLLFRIALYLVLEWKTHLTRIRAVCSKWRTALPLSELPHLDHPMTLPTFLDNLTVFLPESRFHLLSPLQPEPGWALGGKWLARMAQMGSNKWHVFNPLNVHDYFFSTPPVIGSINLLDCRVLELSRTYSLLDANSDEAKPISKKIVGGWNLESSYFFGILVQLERERGGGLWLWRLRDKKWTKIERTSFNDDDNCFQIVDIAFHKGKFYVFDLTSWRIGVIDPDNFSGLMEFISAPEIMNDAFDEKYSFALEGRSYFLWSLHFVQSNGRLYLVIEAFPQNGNTTDDGKEAKSTMVVFVMKDKNGEKEGENTKWEHVKSLGDEIFFIGYDISFSLPSCSVNLPQWKPSSICLFTRPFPLLFDGLGDKKEVPKGLKSLQSLTFTQYWRYYRLFEMRGEEEEKEEENSVVSFGKKPMQVYTGLFFPPPPWAQWRCPELDNVEISFQGLEFHKDGSW